MFHLRTSSHITLTWFPRVDFLKICTRKKLLSYSVPPP
uniref:Uncharacterized protein n=1 Tax=Anguilla anguilla TaxID=7936 RepID=A0A0E9QW77_ANGAN